MIILLKFVLFIGFLSVGARTECAGIKWVDISQFNNESEPFIGGQEGELSVYPCRVTHQGNVVAGKAMIRFGFRSCWIAAGGREVEYTEKFDILTNPNGAAILQYVKTASGQPIPADAFELSRHKNGNIIHMSRAVIDNKLTLGKVVNGFASIPYFRNEIFAQDYEILTCTTNQHPDEHEMRIVNNCNFSIQVGLKGDNFTPENGSFVMNAGEQQSHWVPRGWSSGRIWANTNCGSNNCCETEDCGTCKVENGDEKCLADATVAEFNLDKSNEGEDYYDVSLLDGFNLQMTIEPIAGTFQTSQFGNKKYDCQVAGCSYDMRSDCPDELKKIVNGKTVSCLSACSKFGSNDYCCTIGSLFGSPQTCRPSPYSDHFKRRCPLAFSYAYDDEESTFKCKSAPQRLVGYLTKFCP